MDESELRSMNSADFERAIDVALATYGNLASACREQGWKYDRVYKRLYGLGKRCQNRSQVVDVT